MAKQITPFSISAPGFYGLNTSESPVDLSPNFALNAENCIIDKSGRVASRKGWDKAHTANTDLSTNPITCIGELIENDGTATTLATGNGFLYKLSGTTLVTLTYGGGGVAPTINDDNWFFCQLNGVAMFWQRGYDPLIYEPAVSTTAFRRLNEKSGSAGTVYQCNVAISAYGRVWAADTTTDKQTLVFSDLLTPHIWTGGTAGSLDLRQVWPSGGDEIVALAAHNDLLFIFGKWQTLIYRGATDPATMELQDTIVGIGCIARDSVQNTGNDIIFLADSGVQSLRRTIQEKSAPIIPFSKNVNGDIQDLVTANTADDIKSGYSAVNNMYVLTFPSNSITYCFDTRLLLQDGSARVTTWSLTPSSYYETKNRKFYLGMPGYIGDHAGYLDDTAEYRIKYYTTWIDFGNPIQISILKKILMTLIGGSNQSIVFKWAYDFVTSYFTETATLGTIGNPAEWGNFEWNDGSEYGTSISIETLSVNGSSAGRVLQFGFEAQINDLAIAIQKIDLFSKEGNLRA